MYQTLASQIVKHFSLRGMWQAVVSRKGMDRLRTGLMVFSLVTGSAVAGSAIGSTGLLRRRHVGVNTSLFMQAVAVPANSHTVVVGGASTETTLAIDSLKLDQITGQNQESIDDRHTIHDQVASIATTENNHYNLLTDRLNVSDARVTTIGWVLGTLFTVSQAVVLFFHLDKRYEARAAVAPRKKVKTGGE